MRSYNKSIVNLILSLALLAACPGLAAAEEQKPIQPPAAKVRQPKEPGIEPLKETDDVAVIATNFGSIVIRFFPEIAPNHVKNFIALAQSKFYDGTTFHRVIPGFMIQGGSPNSKDDDPANDGIGRGPRMIDAEFSRVNHVRGIVSAARGGDPNSASCQFFIMVAAAPHLDGQYSAFGEVVKGLEVADKIVALPRDKGDNPGKASLVKSVTIQKAGEVLKFPLN